MQDRDAVPRGLERNCRGARARRRPGWHRFEPAPHDARRYGDDRTPIVDSRRAKIERKPLPDRASVLRRCHAERPHERTRHVTLIGKAGAGSGIGERQPSFDETPRERDAPLNQIGVGR